MHPIKVSDVVVAAFFFNKALYFRIVSCVTRMVLSLIRAPLFKRNT